MHPSVTLDRIDVQLVRALQDDARISNKDLAQMVGLSPSACLERVRRLVAEGVLSGFHAEVEPTAVGIGLETLLMIRLQRHTRRVLDSFIAHCQSFEEVVGLWHITGASDFVLQIVTRDQGHLRDFLMDALTTRPEVAHVESHVVFWRDRKKRWPVWP